MNTSGLLISFEGISGAGKTVLIDQFERHLNGIGYKTLRKSDLYFYSGEGLGKDIKAILKKYSRNNNDNPFFQFGYPIIETLLILAKRSFESEERLNPHLSKNYIILADRDIDTVCTYQLASLLKYDSHFVSLELIDLIRKINSLNTMNPNLTFYLDISISKAIERVKIRDNKTFTEEQILFLKEAKSYYKEVLSIPLNGRVLKSINTSQLSKEDVAKKGINIFNKWIKEKQF